MRHPYIDEHRYRRQLSILFDTIDRVINFFDRDYITDLEAVGLMQYGESTPGVGKTNGHVETYGPFGIYPKYIKTPIVRIVYNNNKWCTWSGNFNNCSVAVTIEDNPRILKKHFKLKPGDMSQEDFNGLLKFVSKHKDHLLDNWNGNCYNIPLDKEDKYLLR